MSLLACSMVAGCVADESTGSEEQAETASASSSVSASAPGAATETPVPPELRMAGAGGTTDATSCTYIQWCDKPNSPEKIVCVLRPSCVDTCQTQNGRDSVVAACQNNALYICGATGPITYHGCNGLGPP